MLQRGSREYERALGPGFDENKKLAGRTVSVLLADADRHEWKVVTGRAAIDDETARTALLRVDTQAGRQTINLNFVSELWVSKD